MKNKSLVSLVAVHTHTHTHTYSLWEGGNGLNYISLLLLRGGGAR